MPWLKAIGGLDPACVKKTDMKTWHSSALISLRHRPQERYIIILLLVQPQTEAQAFQGGWPGLFLF